MIAGLFSTCAELYQPMGIPAFIMTGKGLSSSHGQPTFDHV